MNETISSQAMLPEMQNLLYLCAQTRYSALLPPSDQEGAGDRKSTRLNSSHH